MQFPEGSALSTFAFLVPPTIYPRLLPIYRAGKTGKQGSTSYLMCHTAHYVP